MNLQILKGVCDLLTTVFALAAAGAWFRAALAPLPFSSWPDPSDQATYWAATKAYLGFTRGAIWNRRAAALTGMSALISVVPWVISILSSIAG